MTPLLTFPIYSPGSLGLNTEDQDSVLDPRYATVAYNCVLSRNGRLEARKGWSKINSTAATGTPTLDTVHSYITDAGVEVLVSSGGNKIWTGDTTLTDSTGSISITADHWQFQNNQGNCIGVQEDHEPIWWDGSGNFEYLVDQNSQWVLNTAYSLGDIVVPTSRNGYYYECTTAGTSSGSEPTWDTDPTTPGTTTDNTVTWTTRQIAKSNVALSAFGRLWISDGTTIYYSDLLIPYAFSGGSSGSIDLNTVWTTSNDIVKAISVHNNNLIILCTKSIVIYGNADDISNISLVDVINNIGCVARDSVQSLGDDLLWLSEQGVRSLSRTIIQDNMPLGTASANIRTELIGIIGQETSKETIRSVYNEVEGLYLVTFPTVGFVLSFDVRLYAQNKLVRPFIWDSMSPYGMATRKNGDLIFGMAGGFLGKYATYLDNSSTYIMKFRSGWIDVGSQGLELIWKKMRAYLYSNYSVQTVASWGFDFETAESTQQKQVTATDVSEYNIAEYNVDEYGSGTTAIELLYTLTGTGELIRFGFQAVINSGRIGVNKITLQAKRGKLN